MFWEAVILLLNLVLLYALFILLFKYCILRRPVIKPKLVILDKEELTAPETEEERNSMDESNRWCIIGAGFAGLAMASSFQKKKVPFVVYERDQKIGGNWQQGTYSGVHMISSKKITQIPDFPMPDHFPDFPSAEQVRNYLQNYAEHFHLLENIRFSTEIVMTDPILDGTQWIVTLADGTQIKYKGVIVCIGHDWKPNMPTFEGKQNLEIIHSRSYKSGEIFKGKRVLTIGAGNSGVDITCDAGRFAEKSCISMRRGYWFVPRMLFGRPTFENIPFWMPAKLQQYFIRFGFYCMYGNLSSYGLPEPKYEMYDHPLSITDQIFQDIRKGRVHVRPGIRSVDGDVVTFVDGTKEEFDLIVLATGYHVSLPMIEHLLEFKQGVAQLVHGVVHPRLKNLYVLGFGFARSGAGPLLFAAAATIERSIRIQEKITFPIGRILLKTGSRIPQKGKESKDILIDPFKAFGKEFLGRYLLPTVPFFEKLLFNPKKYNPEQTLLLLQQRIQEEKQANKST